MPLASMSKVTSICGTPRGAGGRSTSWNLPSVLLYMAISRSPWSTWISTDGWLSSAVVNTSERLVGMVVLRSMSRCMTLPLVSMPSDSGVTSRSRTSFTSPFSTPACTAAPMATTSSGLTPLWGSLPVSDWTRSWMAGIRVEPPTSTTWSMSDLLRPASVMACSNGPLQASTRSAVSSLNLARVSFRSRCLGPSEVAVMKGRLIWVSCTDDSSIFAFSAASFRRCRAILSADRSTPSVFLNSVTSQSMTRWSQSSPPRWVLPEVDFTSNTPSPISRIGHVEGATTEVEDEDGLLLVLLVEAVGERRGGGLVDDAQHLEAGDLARLLGGGALGVVEVGGDGDDGLVDGVAQVGLGVPLELLQDAGRDLLGGVLLAVDVDRSTTSPCGA